MRVPARSRNSAEGVADDLPAGPRSLPDPHKPGIREGPERPSPLEKRTFARNYRQSHGANRRIHPHAKAHTRRKSRRSIRHQGARAPLYRRRPQGMAVPGKEPSPSLGASSGKRSAAQGRLFHFGGEIFVKYESGDVHYQDEFGRTEKPREFLIKKPPDKPFRRATTADAGRGKCVQGVLPVEARGAAPGLEREEHPRTQHHAAKRHRERAELDPERTGSVRRELTDEKISKI